MKIAELEKALEKPNIVVYLVDDHTGGIIKDITGEVERLIKSRRSRFGITFTEEEIKLLIEDIETGAVFDRLFSGRCEPKKQLEEKMRQIKLYKRILEKLKEAEVENESM